MKIKRLAILALAVLLAFGALFALSACGGEEAHTHTLVHHEAKAPDCDSVGNIEYWSCNGCGKNFLDQNANVVANNIIRPAEHKGGTELRNAVAATEAADGYTGDTYCLGCGEKISEGSVIPKLPHTHATEKVDGVEATCKKVGNIEYWVCTICGGKYSEEAAKNELSDSDVVIPSEHTGDTEIRDAVAATETAEGYTGDTYCLTCGEKIAEGTTIPKLDHAHVIEKVETDSQETMSAISGAMPNIPGLF